MYMIKKVSELSGVSVRTLHHYDEISLLSPKRSDSGYRLYTEEDLEKLQVILFYKYLGFSLAEIKELVQIEDNQLIQHLRNQLLLMKEQKDRLLTLISTLERTIYAKERKLSMKTEEKFTGFRYDDHEKYKKATSEKYGEEILKESQRRQKGNEEEITKKFNQIFFSFSKNRLDKLAVSSEENIALAKQLHEHLCTYAFDCSIDVFLSIGRGYALNPEFKKNIDQFGVGTAEYVRDAIEVYFNQSKKD